MHVLAVRKKNKTRKNKGNKSYEIQVIKYQIFKDGSRITKAGGKETEEEKMK